MKKPMKEIEVEEKIPLVISPEKMQEALKRMRLKKSLKREADITNEEAKSQSWSKRIRED